jgi:hypothetical protein
MKAWLTKIGRRLVKVFIMSTFVLLLCILCAWVILGIFSPVLLVLLIAKW